MNPSRVKTTGRVNTSAVTVMQPMNVSVLMAMSANTVRYSVSHGLHIDDLVQDYTVAPVR